jgi:S1-C subfamily serine protease
MVSVIPAPGEAGKRVEDSTEDLERAMKRSEPKTVSVKFSRADGVLLKWRQLPAPVDEIDPVNPHGDTQADPTIDNGEPDDEPAVVDTTAILSAARGGIVELKIERRTEGVLTIVPSPVMTDRHYVVAPIQSVAGVKRVHVDLPGVTKPVEAKLVKVDLNVGLALMELDTTFVPMARSVLKPIKLASQSPTVGERVWLASLANGQPKLDTKAVDELVSYDGLDRQLKSAMRHSPLSQWIQVEGGITTGQSNAAALNGAGELVGLAAWAWTNRARYGAILSAEHVKALVNAPTPDPMSYAQLNELIDPTDLPRMTFAHVETVTDQPADQLRRFNAVLRTTAQCRACEGSGVKLTRRRVGYESIGGNMRKAIYRNEYEHCAICKGTGLKDENTLRRAIGNVVTGAARVAGDEQTTEASLEAVRDSLRDMTLDNLDSITALVNGQARLMLAGGTDNIGQPIVMVGSYINQVELPGEVKPFMGLKVDGQNRGDETRVLVDRPRFVDPTESRTAMVAGVLAGFIQRESDEPPIALISHGLVIPIDTTKAVERKTLDEWNKELEEERREREEKIEAERRRIERQRDREDRDRRY